MKFYPTLLDAAREEIIPLLGSVGLTAEYDLTGLAAEVFTLDPVSGLFTHTGEGITDEMMERHAY